MEVRKGGRVEGNRVSGIRVNANRSLGSHPAIFFEQKVTKVTKDTKVEFCSMKNHCESSTVVLMEIQIGSFIEFDGALLISRITPCLMP